jgi:hypothetical protein
MACIPGLGAVSGSDGMDLVLEYILLDACGLLRLHPFVPGSYGRCFPRPGVGNAYPFVGNQRVHDTGVPGSFLRPTREARWVVRWLNPGCPC